MLFNRILALASIPCYGMVRAAKNRQNVSGGERLGHFGGPFWATPFPLARGSQNGPRPQGFASPRNNGAPLTAAGRSERTPHSKRERVRAESYQTAALLAPFSTAIDISRLTVRSAAGLKRLQHAPDGSVLFRFELKLIEQQAYERQASH